MLNVCHLIKLFLLLTATDIKTQIDDNKEKIFPMIKDVSIAFLFNSQIRLTSRAFCHHHIQKSNICLTLLLLFATIKA